MTTRSCDSCTMCCKLPGITELNKSAGRWCEFVHIGKGCREYQSRPEACRHFECLWLISEMPDTMRPDRIKAVISGTADGTRAVVYIDPATPDHYKTNAELWRAIGYLRSNRDAIIVCGDNRNVLPRI